VNYSLPFMMMARIEVKKRTRNLLETRDVFVALKSDFVSQTLTQLEGP